MNIKVSKEKLVEILKELPNAAIPELLDYLPSIITGSLGVSLPFVGNIILNVKQTMDSKKIEAEIKVLKEKILSYKLEEQNEIKSAIQKLYTTQITHDLNNKNAEVYTVDSMEIELRTEEEYEDIVLAILEALQEDGGGQIYELVENSFVNGNKIVINLLEPLKRTDLDDLIGEIDAIVYNSCDGFWGNSLIKRIYFY